MTDETSGATGESADDEVLPKWGTAELTLRFPPFPEPGALSDPYFAPHDPVRARAVVEALGTVAEVLEELPDRPEVGDVSSTAVRADLELVAVGCWGNVVHVLDPALVGDLLADPMDTEVLRQRQLHPEARIAGSVEVDYGNSYLQDLVVLPGGEEMNVFGWDCDDDWDYVGDPEAVLRALGIGREAAAAAEFDLDEEPRDRDWSALGTLAIWGVATGHHAVDRQVSVFRVRRTENAAFDLEEIWFGRS
ncbi:DUF6333 family protein [Streptomyces sp. NPDC050738]|uniref:DUF6333 family protein n=1 Tax=Streptomyces sp. NPDC050738 TaxID=3154744 RepID=UPI00341DCE73